MNKTILVLIISFIAASCDYKSGSGHIITREKKVEPFTRLKVAGDFNVVVSNGTSPKVIIEADDNLIDDVEVKVVAGELRIRLDENNVGDAHLKVKVTTSQLNSIHGSAAAEFILKDILQGQQLLEFDVSSSASIEGRVDAPEVKAEASSGAELHLSGKTKDLTVSASSGGSIKCEELLSENTIARASSGGNAHVYASVNLEANASSGGNITYKGAANVQKTESSGGSVRKED